MDIESRARVKHGPMDSSWQCGPPHFSFPQQASPPTQTPAKQKTAEHQRTMHSRPKIPVISSRKMQRRHRHEFDRLPSPDPRLSLRFMPGRSRRIQRRGICMEILSPIGTAIPRIQQPPRTHRGHYHNVGRHSSRTFETWRLCPFDDRQHNISRMASKI